MNIFAFLQSTRKEVGATGIGAISPPREGGIRPKETCSLHDSCSQESIEGWLVRN